MNYNLRLYWGENFTPKPYNVKKRLEKAVLESLQRIHLYPGIIQEETVNCLAKKYCLNKNKIITGNGIESLVHLISRTIGKNKKVAILSPSFTLYKQATIVYGGKVIKIQVRTGQKFSVDELLEKVKDSKLFFLAYPNNPTGQYIIDPDKIDKFLNSYQGILVADECYYGIGENTLLDLTKKHANLLVLRSFSKTVGLAGIRFGFAVGKEKMIEELKKYSSNIEVDKLNIFSCLVVQAVLPYTDKLVNNFKNLKEKFEGYLKKSGFDVVESKTSFVLIQLKKENKVQKVIEKLKEKGIQVKKNKDLNENILIFAVPKKTDWKYFIASLKKSL